MGFPLAQGSKVHAILAFATFTHQVVESYLTAGT